MSEELPLQHVVRNRYVILSRLGRGSFSRVYLARDLQDNNTYRAIKQMGTRDLNPKDAEAMTGMFMAEARMLSSLHHEGLPAVHAIFIERGSYFLVLEWIPGQTLLAIMQELDMAIPLRETLVWGIDLCDILDYLHGQQPNPAIVGDLKPSNIMRTFSGRLKLLDFGIARYAHAVRGKKRMTFVSPGFSPPEQYGKQEIDHRSDIYSLGATLYYLLTAESLARFNFQVPPLHKFLPSASGEMDRILAKCLAEKRNGRYGSVQAVKQDLEKQLAELNSRMGSEPTDILAEFYKAKRAGLGLDDKQPARGEDGVASLSN